MAMHKNLELSSFDNRVISITGRTDSELAHALALFIDQDPTRREPHVKAYRVSPTHGMILYWSAPENPVAPMQRLPFRASFELLVMWCRDWLAAAKYPEQPDIDGSIDKGWRVFNEEWTHVDDQWGALCAIQPVWAMYGK